MRLNEEDNKDFIYHHYDTGRRVLAVQLKTM